LQSGGGLSTIQQPGQLAVDGAGNLYVASFPKASDAYYPFPPEAGGTLLVFGPTANGNVGPTRTLNVDPVELAVDPSGNVYVYPYDDTANNTPDAIAVFAAGASGNATPTRVIDSAEDVDGLLADSVGNLFVVKGGLALYVNYCIGNAYIYQFSPTESGTATTAMPTAVYQGGLTGCGGGSAIAIH
jgi:hypothetical protein